MNIDGDVGFHSKDVASLRVDHVITVDEFTGSLNVNVPHLSIIRVPRLEGFGVGGQEQ